MQELSKGYELGIFFILIEQKALQWRWSIGFLSLFLILHYSNLVCVCVFHGGHLWASWIMVIQWVSLVWGNSQSLLFKFFFFPLSFPSSMPKHTLYLFKLFLCSWIFCSVFSFFVFGFGFWKFLLTFLKTHWFFPWLCPVY